MNTTKILTAAALSAALCSPVLAQNTPPQQDGSSGGVPSDAVYLDPAPFIKEVDANKDGNLSKEEWQSAGLVESVFSRFDKDNKGYLTQTEVAGMHHPPALDSNKDGKLALSEIKAHMAKQSAQGQGQGQPPQGAGQPE